MNIELNHIYNMDCLEGMKKIEDNSIDMVLCDLPYGTTSNKWDSIIDLDKLWEEYNRICKPTAAIVLTASQPFTSKLVMSNPKMFKHEWIWQKNRGSNFANTVREPMKEHEEILVFSKGKWTYNKQMQERSEGGKSRVKYDFNHVTESTNYSKFTKSQNKNCSDLRVPSSIQKFNIDTGKNHFHPTQKPVELFRYLIRTYSNKGDLVLDNCMGSATTAIASLIEGRNYIGFENNKEYYEKSLERIKNFENIIKDNEK